MDRFCNHLHLLVFLDYFELEYLYQQAVSERLSQLLLKNPHLNMKLQLNLILQEFLLNQLKKGTAGPAHVGLLLATTKKQLRNRHYDISYICILHITGPPAGSIKRRTGSRAAAAGRGRTSSGPLSGAPTRRRRRRGTWR